MPSLEETKEMEMEKAKTKFLSSEIEQYQKDIRLYVQALAELSTSNIALLGAKKELENELERLKINEEMTRRDYNRTQDSCIKASTEVAILVDCLVEIKKYVENSCWEKADIEIKKEIINKITKAKEELCQK